MKRDFNGEELPVIRAQDGPLPGELADNESLQFQPHVELAPLSLSDIIRRPKGIALYVHVPFCERKCTFCDFLVIAGSVVTKSLKDEYINAVCQEIRFYAPILRSQNIRINMIQFGGGTPSLLTPAQINSLLEAIHEHLDCSALQEVVFEAFPSTVTADKLAAIGQCSTVKLNMGVQTFEDPLLDLVGRPHTSEQVVSALKLASERGLASVGVDLICGLPGSSAATTTSDIRRAAELGADHITVYPLWLYPGTILYQRVMGGEITAPGAEERKMRLAEAHSLLDELGFEQYSIFHFGMNSSRHLYGLWQMRDREWLGLGVGAVSHVFGAVFSNVRDIREYMRRAKSGMDCVESGRVLTARERMRRTLVFGMRLRDFELHWFSERYGCRVQDVFAGELDRFERHGLLQQTETSIRLTLEGIMRLKSIEDSFDAQESQTA